MIIDFSLDEKDFLAYQLYTASKSEKIIKKRKRNKLMVPLFYGLIAVLFIVQENPPVSAAFLALGMLWFLFYPKWETRRYANYYRDFIKENYKSHIGKKATLEITNDFISAKDDGTESNVPTSDISVIKEIPTHIFITLKSGETFILPKEKVQDLPALIGLLKESATKANAKYSTEQAWKWK